MCSDLSDVSGVCSILPRSCIPSPSSLPLFLPRCVPCSTDMCDLYSDLHDLYGDVYDLCSDLSDLFSDLSDTCSDLFDLSDL